MLYTYHFLFNILHVIPKQFIEFLKMEIDKLNCIWKCKSPIIDKEILKKKCNWRCYTIRFSVIFYVILIKAVQCWRMNRKTDLQNKTDVRKKPTYMGFFHIYEQLIYTKAGCSTARKGLVFSILYSFNWISPWEYKGGEDWYCPVS